MTPGAGLAPVLVVRTVASRQVVSAACEASLRAGVRAGQVLADARALLKSEPMIVEDDPAEDVRRLRALARWAMRWSPVVSADGLDGLLVDISGCEHLFGGELRLVNQMAERLGRLGLTPRAAVASTVGAAWAAARFGGAGRGDGASVRRVAPGQERAALSPLPVRALRLAPAAVEGLAEVGVERVGQLLALPRSALPARYGVEVLRRLDQALGAADEPVDRLGEQVRYEASVDLPGGTTNLEAVGLATRAVLGDLARQLAGRESGLRRLDVVYTRLDSAAESVLVQVSRATRDAGHLWKLVRPRLERLNMGFGVEGITARASGVGVMVQRQGSMSPREATGDPAAFSAMLDTIGNRLGPGRVLRAQWLASHRPERASRLVPALNGAGLEGAAELPACAAALPRPSRLFDRPEPVRVVALSPDGPVISVSGRVAGEMVNGGLGGGSNERGVAIVTSIGPERIGGEWWRAREGSRDYFRVQDGGGRWLWLYRESATGAWFAHGEWA